MIYNSGACPICDSKSLHIDVNNGIYLRLRSHQKLLTCKKCNHSWKTPNIHQDFLLENKIELRSGLVQYGSYTANISSEFNIPIHLKDRLNLIKKEGVLLDFGCGDGSFISYARNIGINAFGCDQDLSNILDVNLTNYVKKDITDFDERSFNFVNMNHVLEHVQYPIKTLGLIHKYLTNNGVILIEVPNELQSMSTKIKKNYTLTQIQQLVYMNTSIFSQKNRLL